MTLKLAEVSGDVKGLTDELASLHFFDRPNVPHFVGKHVVSVGEDNAVLIRSYSEGTIFYLRRYAEIKDGVIDVLEPRNFSERSAKVVLRNLIAQLS